MRIRNGNKRGIWKYEINNAHAELDNGLKYSPEELNAYKLHALKVGAEIELPDLEEEEKD